jgi:hypothetical protein
MMEAFVGRLVAVPVVPTVVPAVGLELDQVCFLKKYFN